MTASRVEWITDRSVRPVWTMASGRHNTGPNGPGLGGPDTMLGYFQHRRATLRTLLTSEGRWPEPTCATGQPSAA